MSGNVNSGGIGGVADAPFGTHGCLFYETKQDLLDTLVSFFKTGLEHRDACLWIVSEPLTMEEAAQALRQSIPAIDRYLSEQSIELTSCGGWCFEGRPDDLSRIVGLLHIKLAGALAKGHTGLRVGRHSGALEQRNWQSIHDFESQLNNAIAVGPLTMLCTYPIGGSGAAELLEATHWHPVCATVRKGDWEFIETPELKEAKAELKRLNQRLDQKVGERTQAMHAANEELRKENEERNRVEDELRSQKEVLEKVFDHIPVMISCIDPGGKIKLVNREWQRVVGRTLEEIREHNVDIVDIISECYPNPQDRQEVLDFISSSNGEWKELKARVRDGRLLDTIWAVARLSDGSSIGFGRDITEQRQWEHRLKASAEKLRALSANIQAAREEERTVVARLIHDELGSAFTSLKWDLEGLDTALSKPLDPATAAALSAKIAGMMKLSESTINTVRRIAWELRPSILDDLGLVDAIEWQARQFEARTGIVCQRSDFIDNVAFTEVQATAIFRIFQEALTNILRHANATRVDITISQEAREFVLAISDNGRGITGVEKSGLGILGMQERVRLVGGKIEIHGREGAGTTISVRVPISGEGTPAPERE
ncbi:MAG TPA: MEDS domain-containing protein [Bryobacteraceae bacterium]|nr:MEDS domain-containing protein [Bryobacteraceae bacterium]